MKPLPTPLISRPGRPARNPAVETLAQSIMALTDLHCRLGTPVERATVFEAVNALAIATGTVLAKRHEGEAEFFMRALECQLAGSTPAPQDADPPEQRSRKVRSDAT